MKIIHLVVIVISLLSGCATMIDSSLSATDINSLFPGNSLATTNPDETYYFIPDGSLIYRDKERKETRAGKWFVDKVIIQGRLHDALCVPSGLTGNAEFTKMRCFQFTGDNGPFTNQWRWFDTTFLSCEGSREKGIKCYEVGFGGVVKLSKSEIIDDSQKRFEINGQLTVFDSKTKLNWMRCTLGQVSTPIEACETPPVKFRGFDEINAYIKDFNLKGYAGHNDWRLPSYEELSTLIWCGGETTPKDGESCWTVMGEDKAKSPTSWNVFSTQKALYISSSRSHKIMVVGGTIGRPIEDKIPTFGVINFRHGYRGWWLKQQLFSPGFDLEYVLVRLVRGGKHGQ